MRLNKKQEKALQIAIDAISSRAGFLSSEEEDALEEITDMLSSSWEERRKRKLHHTIIKHNLFEYKK